MLMHGGFSNLLHSNTSLPIFSTNKKIISTVIPSQPIFVVNIKSFAIRTNYNKKLNRKRHQSICFLARRRVRYEDEEDDEEYGHNYDIDMLESYSQSARNEALLVRAMVDGQEEEVLIFKGFSSCLSYRTTSNASKSILPSRALITSVDRVVGPFDPTNIEYIEKGLTWETFKNRIMSPT